MSDRDHLLLAIDTAGAEAGIVLAGQGSTAVAPLPAGPSGSARTEELSAAAAGLLRARGLASGGLTLLGAVTGPGSYTGLRSGLAFLRGLAFADATPAVGVGALELLAWRGSAEGERVLAASEAGSGRLAVAMFLRRGDDVEEVSAPRVVTVEECAATFRQAGAVAIVASPASAEASFARGAPLAGAAREAGLDLRVPGDGALEALALLVAARGRAGRVTSAAALVPLYVGEARARPNRHRVAVSVSPE